MQSNNAMDLNNMLGISKTDEQSSQAAQDAPVSHSNLPVGFPAAAAPQTFQAQQWAVDTGAPVQQNFLASAANQQHAGVYHVQPNSALPGAYGVANYPLTASP